MEWQCLDLYAEPGESAIASMAFSPDGKWLASTSRSQILRLWDATTGKCLFSVSNGGGRVSFNLDGSHILKSVGIFGVAKTFNTSRAHWIGYHIKTKIWWISWNGINVLWLPPEYRPEKPGDSAICGNCVTIFRSAGTISTVFVQNS